MRVKIYINNLKEGAAHEEGPPDVLTALSVAPSRLRGAAARPILKESGSAGPGGIIAAHAVFISHGGGRHCGRCQTNRQRKSRRDHKSFENRRHCLPPKTSASMNRGYSRTR